MNKFLTLVAFFFMSSSAQANLIQPPEVAIGAEALVRQVLNNGRLKGEDASFTESLERTIDAATSSSKKTVMTGMICDHVLGGQDACSISFVESDANDQEREGSSFTLELRLRKGHVISATVAGFVG